jgi:diguanylate cyclase (GGDEF)-like protein/PAS domain S-box-containing protein
VKKRFVATPAADGSPPGTTAPAGPADDAAARELRTAPPRGPRRVTPGNALLLTLMLIIPLAGAWGLHSLTVYVAERTTAELQLKNLNADFNATATDLVWAIALHLPRAAAKQAVSADSAKLNQDIAALRAGGAANDANVVTAERDSATYIATLAGGGALLASPGFDISSPAVGPIIAAAQTQHTAAAAAIAAASITLQQESDSAGRVAEIGIWVIVLLGSAALIGGTWRAQTRKRRTAVAEAGREILAQSEQTYRLLFDRNPTPMWTLDAGSARFLSVNRAARARYGYTSDEFKAMSVPDLRLPADRPGYALPSPLLGRPVTIATRHVTKSGEILDVEVVVDDLEVDGRPTTLSLARDVTDQRRLEADLQQRAFHDALTGLGNRALLSDRFEHAQTVRAREDRGLALMVIDLDGFKAINDGFGHGVGDEVLRTVARRLRAVVRPQDTVARIGGDEFAVLVDGVQNSDAVDLGGRIITAVSAPFEIRGSTIEITPSAGVTAVETHEVSLDEAMQHADIAMYEAKASGNGEVRLFEAGMRSSVLERLELASGLKRAMARNELVLHYQPIVDTRFPEGPVQQVEALVRWLHPQHGLVAPNDFIPMAEQTGVIVPLGAWVLRAACDQVRAWDALDQHLKVSVNVSSRELRDPGFVDSVARTLAATGVAPARLTLEITETALLEDLPQATRILGELRGMGVCVALDDFGAGYSSLSYLDRLPVDVVKIDRTFIAGITKTSKRETLKTIARLLASIDVRVVAEGVETVAQFAFVQGLGIGACQGFLFSRPVPAAEVIDSVRTTYQPIAITSAA